MINMWKAIPLTIIVQAALYIITDDRDTYNNAWIIIAEFIGLAYLLEMKWDRKGGSRNKGKSENVVELDQFRKRREKEGKKSDSQKKEKLWVTLYSGTNAAEMELIHSMLTSHRIECNITNRHTSSLFPSVDEMKMILQVKPEDLLRSKELLKQHDLKSE